MSRLQEQRAASADHRQAYADALLQVRRIEPLQATAAYRESFETIIGWIKAGYGNWNDDVTRIDESIEAERPARYVVEVETNAGPACQPFASFDTRDAAIAHLAVTVRPRADGHNWLSGWGEVTSARVRLDKGTKGIVADWTPAGGWSLRDDEEVGL